MANLLLWGDLTSTLCTSSLQPPPPPPQPPSLDVPITIQRRDGRWAKTASSMPILICYVMILFSLLVFISFLSRHWAIPENIHTYTTDGFYDFGMGGGVHDYGILREWGGIYDWKSEGMGKFDRWDF